MNKLFPIYIAILSMTVSLIILYSAKNNPKLREALQKSKKIQIAFFVFGFLILSGAILSLFYF